MAKSISLTPPSILLAAALLLAAVCAGPTLALEASDAVTVTPLLKTTHSWDGTAISYPAGQAEATMMIVELAADGETGWHQHPVPSFGYILEGRMALTLEDGHSRELQAGDAIAEVVGDNHNGRALDGKPVKILVLYSGSEGMPLTVPRREPHGGTP